MNSSGLKYLWVFLFLFLLFVENGFAATVSSRAKGTAFLETAIEKEIPQAFIKGNKVRIYYSRDGKIVVFKAHWKKSPIQGYQFVQYIAELELEKLPAEPPDPKSGWSRAVVFNHQGWTNLVNNIAERLTPEKPEEGIYFNFLFRDATIYRDAFGKIHATTPENMPTDVEIVRRYNVKEFSETASKILASQLPGLDENKAFLFIQEQRKRPIRFLLMDTENRFCVSLYEPHIGENTSEGIPFESSFKILTSLVFESHLLSVVKNPFSTTCRLLNTGWQLSMSLLHIRLPQFSSQIPDVSNAPPMDLEEWEKWLDKKTHRKAQDATVRFLIDGESYFPVLTEQIKAATNKVQMRVSIFDNDDVAVDVADLLKERSQEIKVDVLLDLLSTQTSSYSQPETPMKEKFVQPSSIRRYLQKDSKVHVRAFLNPWFTSDHSKLVIIDGHTAFIGGMNIGREYRYEWHDLMAEVHGPIISTLKFDFEKAWSHAGLLGDFGCFLTFFGKYPDKGDYLRMPGEKYAPVRVLYTKTANLELKSTLFEAISRAKNHIYIENSYLFDSSFAGALAKARRRGVDVRVVLPERCDTPGGNSSIYVTANYLFNNGVKVYLYPGMTHIKAALIDGWSCFGSANFNRLSLRRNQEINLGTSDAGISSKLKQELFEVDFKKSYLLKEPIEVSWTDHIAESILNQF